MTPEATSTRLRFLAGMGAFALLIAAVFVLWQSGLPESDDGLGEVYAFEAQTLDGHVIEVDKNIGRPVVINFWATWCPPCIIEMPILQDAYQTYGDEGLLVVGINAGGESPEYVQEWLTANRITFPVVMDTFRELEAAYEILGLPMTFFIDAEGRIQKIADGNFNTREFNEGLRSIGIR